MSMAMAVAGVVVDRGVEEGGRGGVERLASVAGILFVEMAVGCLVGAPTSGRFWMVLGMWGSIVVWAGGVMFWGGCMVVGVKVMTSRRFFDRV